MLTRVCAMLAALQPEKKKAAPKPRAAAATPRSAKKGKSKARMRSAAARMRPCAATLTLSHARDHAQDVAFDDDDE